MMGKLRVGTSGVLCGVLLASQGALGGEDVIVVEQDDAEHALSQQIAPLKKKHDAIAGGSNIALPQEENRTATLEDALDYQPGVLAQSFSGGTDQPRLSIRGSGIQSFPLSRGLLLLEDGLPLNEADGSFHIGLLDFRDTRFVAVRRGANALNPAAAALGGEVDLISLTGEQDAGGVRYEYGSFGRQGMQAAVGGSDGDLDGRISYSGDRFSGYRDHSSSQRNALRANAGFRAGDNFENRTWLSWTDLRFDIAGPITKSALENDPTSVNTMYAKGDPHRNVEQFRLANQAHWYGESADSTLGVWFSRTHDNFITPLAYNLSNAATYGAQWQLSGRAGALDYHAALSADRSDMDRDLYVNNLWLGRRGQSLGNYDLTAQNLSLQTGLVWPATSALRLTADLGATWSERDANRSGGGAALDQDYRYLTPKIGAIWTPRPDQRWYANLSWSHEAPTFWDILTTTVNPSALTQASSSLNRLDMQRAITAEIGGNGKIVPGLNWSLSLYRSEVRDELIATYDASGSRTGTCNYGAATRHQGVEAGLSGRQSVGQGAIDYRLAWTWSDFRFRGGEFKGNQIAGVPRHVISGEVLYGQGNWRLGPTLHWVPESTPTDHSNSGIQTWDAYFLLGAVFDYRLDNGWSFWLRGDNLTNERYASMTTAERANSASSYAQFPGLERNYSAGFSYRF